MDGEGMGRRGRRGRLFAAGDGADRGISLPRGPLLALAGTLVIGTLGYMLIEGWSPGDAAYMAIITLATIGYGEVHPLSGAGRLFTSLLILLGVGALSYAFGSLTQIVFEGQLTHRWERRRMERRIEGTRDHYILCGYGRVGRQIAHELRREGWSFVIVDIDEDELADAAVEGLLTVCGSAHEDEILRAAGIERARGLITAVASDADNIFVVISAHALRPDLPIVARVIHDDAVPKLRRAGATHVVSPYAIAGQRMAALAARPAAVDAVETVLHGDGVDDDLLVEELRVGAASLLAGRTLAAARDEFDPAVIVLGLKRAGRMLAPPPVDLPLQPEDTIAACGTRAQLRAVERACGGEGARAV